MSDNPTKAPGSQISHAQKIDPVKDGKLGDASKNLHSQFDKAREAQLQKQAAARQPSPDMSFAKEKQPEGKDNKLDAASKNLHAQFDRARAAQTEKTQSAAPGGPKAPALQPGMHLRPGGELQKRVDGPIHRQELSDYAKYLKEVNNSAKARQNTQNQAELKNERGKDQDRGR